MLGRHRLARAAKRRSPGVRSCVPTATRSSRTRACAASRWAAVAAHWTVPAKRLQTAPALRRPSGELALDGSVAPDAERVDCMPRRVIRISSSGCRCSASARRLPVTGKLDARTECVGTYLDVAMQPARCGIRRTATAHDRRFEFDATASHGRGTSHRHRSIFSRTLTTTGWGRSVWSDDRLALALHSTSPDVGEFLVRAGEKNIAVHGSSLDSTLRIEGHCPSSRA